MSRRSIVEEVIKTIIFDLGKVIVPFDLRRGYAALQPHCSYPAEEIPKRLSKSDLVVQFEAGQISKEEFVRQLSDLLGITVDYTGFCEAWSAIFFPETIVPDSLLKALRRRYRLVLLSNTNAIHWEMIRDRYPELKNFHAYVLSHEVGAMKPSPKIYQAAIEAAGCRPEECFFTDDIPDFVEGARKAGIDAVQFTGVENLERELRARSVEW